MTRRRVAILFGGRSAEHEISCLSARSVIDALDPEVDEVVPIGIARDGTWHLMAGPPALPAETGRLPEVAPGSGRTVELAGEGATRALVADDGTRHAVDVAFPVLHGPFGEDGSIQGLLELAGVPYVGAGVLGSAIGMDKGVQKRLFREAGIPVVAFEEVREPQWREDPEGVSARAEALGYPLFSKPATLGSSVGVRRLDAPEDLAAGLDEAFRYGRKALLEVALVATREIEVAVLGNDEPVASMPGEIVPQGHAFYDYEAKYLDEHGATLIVPADLKPDVVEELQRLAVAVFRVSECDGMGRVDFFLPTDDRPIVNEINTIPGFTSISMYPKLWEASGVGYRDLVARLLELAIERHGAGSRSTGVRELGLA